MNNTQTSYTGVAYIMFLGIPLGLLTIAAVVVLGLWYMDVYLGESFLFGFMAFALFVKPVLALTAGFLLALWPIGRWVEKCFLRSQKLFWVSLKSSFVLNLVMWISFSIPSVLDTFGGSILKPDPLVTFVIPGASLIISTILTALTWGLLISFLVKRKLKKKMLVQDSSVFQYQS